MEDTDIVTYKTKDEFGSIIIHLRLSIDEITHISPLNWARRTLYKATLPCSKINDIIKSFNTPITDFAPTAHLVRDDLKYALNNLRKIQTDSSINNIDMDGGELSYLIYISNETGETTVTSYRLCDLCEEICDDCGCLKVRDILCDCDKGPRKLTKPIK